MIPLSMVGEGYVKVVRINGGWNLRKRLFAMGIRENCVIYVTVSYPFGPSIVQINGSRVAIGTGMASKIYVEPVRR